MESIKAHRIPYSEIRVMVEAARKLEVQGKEVIHLEIGRPDFDTPGHIVEAAIEALRAGKHHYCPNAGIPELRQAIADKYSTEFHLDYDPASEIVVTNGAAEGVYLAINALLNPGDQVMIPDPGWLNYQTVALTNYVEPVGYSLLERNAFQPDPDEIEDMATQRTRMLILLSPSNPTGSVISGDTLERLAALALKRGWIVLSDEVYERIVYPPAAHHSIACLPGMRDTTVVLNAFSKTYSMTGWRLGYVLGPRKFIDPILRYHLFLLTSVNTFAQWGAIAAINGDQRCSRTMVEEFQRRRDCLYEGIRPVPGFRCALPEGAFYLFVDARATGLNGHEMAKVLLEKAGVVTVAGECFGKNGAGHVRMAYTCSLDKLQKAVTNIRNVMA